MQGTALPVEEREEIRIGLEVSDRSAVLARALGSPPSTISREVHRNGGRRTYRRSLQSAGRSESGDSRSWRASR